MTRAVAWAIAQQDPALSGDIAILQPWQCRRFVQMHARVPYKLTDKSWLISNLSKEDERDIDRLAQLVVELTKDLAAEDEPAAEGPCLIPTNSCVLGCRILLYWRPWRPGWRC